MKKTILSIIIISLFASVTIIAQRYNAKGPRLEQIKEHLNLNDDQEKQFNDLHFDHAQQVVDMRADIQKNRLAIKEMMTNNEVDEAKLRELSTANNEIRGKIHSSKVDMWLNIYKMLNKDQQEIWTKHFAAMGDGREGKHGKRFNKGWNHKGFNKGYGDRPMQKRRMLD